MIAVLGGAGLCSCYLFAAAFRPSCGARSNWMVSSLGLKLVHRLALNCVGTEIGYCISSVKSDNS